MAVNLEVGIDASGVVKGSKDAFQALVQLTNATRHLMDGLEAMNGANGALGKFGMLMSRASPYIMAATAAMGAISLAMNVFSGKTNEAADAQQRLAEAIAKARKEQDVAKLLGESPAAGMKGESSAVRDLIASLSKSPTTVGAFSSKLGVDQSATLRWLMLQGNKEAELGYTGQPIDRTRYQGGRVDRMVTDRIAPGDLTITPEQQQAMLIARFRDIQQRTDRLVEPVRGDMSSWSSYPGSLTSRGPVGQPVGMGLNFPQIAAGHQFNGVSQSEQDQNTVSYENYAAKQRETQQEQLRVMRQTEESARAVGQALGDAATRFVTGMATARELAASLATDLLRTGLTEAATAGARGFFKNFGASASQAAGNGIAGNSGE